MDGTIHPAINIFAHAIKYLGEHLIKSVQKEVPR